MCVYVYRFSLYIRSQDEKQNREWVEALGFGMHLSLRSPCYFQTKAQQSCIEWSELVTNHERGKPQYMLR